MKFSLQTSSLLLLMLLLLRAEAKEKRVQYAGWDDVNVIAHGLLQLGQGLKEHVDRSKVQMRDFSSRLKVFNRTLAELRGESRELRARGEALEEREGEALANATAELRASAEEAERSVRARVGRLEERVEGLARAHNASGDVRGIQLLLEAQSARIDDLVARIKLQQEKLEKQHARIRMLQGQIQESKQRSEVTEEPELAARQQHDHPAEVPGDCHQLFLRGETSNGVYTVQPGDSEPFNVFCEMTSDGGWTVIQRRRDGSVDFDQLWEDYEKGFGNLNGEFWLGLENIYAIVKDGGYVVTIKLSDWADDSVSIRLPFQLGGKERKYSLMTTGTGNFSALESSLGIEVAPGLAFSTRDQDNDRKADTNCAKHLSGGWWFSNCGHSNLNGRYFQSPPPKQRHQRKQSIFWKTWRGRYYPLKSSTMMIGPSAILRS